MRQRIKLDKPFLVFWIILVCFGLVLVFSSSSVASLELTNNKSAFFFIKRQLIYLAIGILLMLVVSATDYRRWRSYTVWLNLLTITLLALVNFTPLGLETNGAKRWLGFMGFQFQPSELAKVVIIITLASMIDKYSRYGRLNTLDFYIRVSFYILFYAAFIGIPQNHASVVLIIVLTSVLMMFFGGINKIIFFSVGAVASIAGILVALTSEFRRKRVLSFLNPLDNELSDGYQITQNWLALGSGEYFGVGLGYGRQKFGWLPENHTDFILGILGEELGYIGIFALLLTFFLMITRGLFISINARDNFGLLIVAGVLGIISVQTILNAAVISGLFPVTGIPLPFISYGGTSMIVFSIMIGMVMSVYKRIDEKELTISDEVREKLKE